MRVLGQPGGVRRTRLHARGDQPARDRDPHCTPQRVALRQRPLERHGRNLDQATRRGREPRERASERAHQDRGRRARLEARVQPRQVHRQVRTRLAERTRANVVPDLRPRAQQLGEQGPRRRAPQQGARLGRDQAQRTRRTPRRGNRRSLGDEAKHAPGDQVLAGHRRPGRRPHRGTCPSLERVRDPRRPREPPFGVQAHPLARTVRPRTGRTRGRARALAHFAREQVPLHPVLETHPQRDRRGRGCHREPVHRHRMDQGEPPRNAVLAHHGRERGQGVAGREDVDQVRS